MEHMEQIRKGFGFTAQDQENLARLAEILLADSDRMADDFYLYLTRNQETAKYFKTAEAVNRRKQTFKAWFTDLLTFLLQLRADFARFRLPTC